MFYKTWQQQEDPSFLSIFLPPPPPSLPLSQSPSFLRRVSFPFFDVLLLIRLFCFLLAFVLFGGIRCDLAASRIVIEVCSCVGCYRIGWRRRIMSHRNEWRYNEKKTPRNFRLRKEKCDIRAVYRPIEMKKNRKIKRVIVHRIREQETQRERERWGDSV